jgi:hypothetical protein
MSNVFPRFVEEFTHPTLFGMAEERRDPHQPSQEGGLKLPQVSLVVRGLTQFVTTVIRRSGEWGLSEAPEPGTRITAIDPLGKIVDMTASAASVVGEPTYRRGAPEPELVEDDVHPTTRWALGRVSSTIGSSPGGANSRDKCRPFSGQKFISPS